MTIHALELVSDKASNRKVARPVGMISGVDVSSVKSVITGGFEGKCSVFSLKCSGKYWGSCGLGNMGWLDANRRTTGWGVDGVS